MTSRAPKRVWIGLALGVAFAHPALAQKDSGPLLPIEPTAPRPPARVPRRASPSLPATPQPGRNPAAERLAEQLPLDPQTRELRDQLPPDTLAVERRLGLRLARGPVTDLRGHTPSPQEIANALAPR